MEKIPHFDLIIDSEVRALVQFREISDCWKSLREGRMVLCCQYWHCFLIFYLPITMIFLRWDLQDMDRLPENMRAFVVFFRGIIKEIEDKVIQNGKLHRWHYFIKALRVHQLISAFGLNAASGATGKFDVVPTALIENPDCDEEAMFVYRPFIPYSPYPEDNPDIESEVCMLNKPPVETFEESSSVSGNLILNHGFPSWWSFQVINASSVCNGLIGLLLYLRKHHASIMADLLGSGRASERLLQIYAPFMAFAASATLRGLFLPCRHSISASHTSHASRKKRA